MGWLISEAWPTPRKLALGFRTEALSFRLLVALLPQWDLLICAKYLFVHARDCALAGAADIRGYAGECPVGMGTKRGSGTSRQGHQPTPRAWQRSHGCGRPGRRAAVRCWAPAEPVGARA